MNAVFSAFKVQQWLASANPNDETSVRVLSRRHSAANVPAVDEDRTSPVEALSV
jgi:hypothetical protein